MVSNLDEQPYTYGHTQSHQSTDETIGMLLIISIFYSSQYTRKATHFPYTPSPKTISSASLLFHIAAQCSDA